MKSFSYTIADPVGIHARPAGILVQEIKRHPGVTVSVACGDRRVDARRLFALLSLGARQGDAVTVSVEGEGEDELAATIEEFFKTYF